MHSFATLLLRNEILFQFGCSKPVEPDCLFDCLPDALRPSSESPGQQHGDGGKNPSATTNSERQAKNSEVAVYTPPTLIAPRILPLLHKLARQLVQAGHQQQCLKSYRYRFHLDVLSTIFLLILLKGIEITSFI